MDMEDELGQNAPSTVLLSAQRRRRIAEKWLVLSKSKWPAELDVVVVWGLNG